MKSEEYWLITKVGAPKNYGGLYNSKSEAVEAAEAIFDKEYIEIVSDGVEVVMLGKRIER